MDRVERIARADALVRATLSLLDGGLRAAYVASIVRAADPASLAWVLDMVCERAEQAEAAAREALTAIVDALNAEGMESIAERLQGEASSESLLALERLMRHSNARSRTDSSDTLRHLQVPADVHGRPLTLGERKSLARRPDRHTLERLFSDPHPDVMRRLLRNPRLTEDDVVRLAARRPGRSDVLAEIARAVRWAHRPRIRIALVMNPATPSEMAARMAGLLVRPELESVVRAPGVPAAVRAVCVEHLERRPPTPRRQGDGGMH